MIAIISNYIKGDWGVFAGVDLIIIRYWWHTVGGWQGHFVYFAIILIRVAVIIYPSGCDINIHG